MAWGQAAGLWKSGEWGRGQALCERSPGAGTKGLKGSHRAGTQHFDKVLSDSRDMQTSCPIREACDVLSVGQHGDEHAWKLQDRRLDDALTSSLRCRLQCPQHQPADTRVRAGVAHQVGPQ